MIKKEDLLNIAKLKGLPPRFAELDYLQEIALLNVCREFGNKLVFKGGTCLYKLYQLNRFSEDLDFTTQKGFKTRDFFERLPFFFNLLSIKSKVKVEKFENEVNIYLDSFGPLYDGKKQSVSTLIFNISSRERIILPIEKHDYIPQYYELRPFSIFSMSEKEILAEKVRAIYGRNKARDVYDLWYLLKVKKMNFEIDLVKKKLSHEKVIFEKDRFLAKIEEKQVSWESDLGQLISGELPSFSSIMKEIEEYLD